MYKVARTSEIHAGIALIRNGVLLRSEQITVVEKAVKAILDELEFGHDMVNRVLYTELDGIIRFETLPPVNFKKSER